MLKRNLGVQNTLEINIASMNNKYVKSNVHKLYRITQERKNSQKYV